MKKFILLLLSAIMLASCTPNTNDPKADMELIVNKTILRADGKLEFDLYVNRPDLGLSEPDNDDNSLYVGDLPKGLRIDYMYVSGLEESTDAQGGFSCNTILFPHRCEAERTDDDNYYVKVSFSDGTFLAKKIFVPYPTTIKNPEITEPAAAPKQGSTLNMKFKDVGADHYEVSVNLCEEYANNGINPCLDGDSYNLQRVDGVLKQQYDWEKFNFTLENDIVTLTSELPMIYGESVVYFVNAQKKDGSILVEASDTKMFENK